MQNFTDAGDECLIRAFWFHPWGHDSGVPTVLSGLLSHTFFLDLAGPGICIHMWLTWK